jgi:hypothetical protein
MPNLWRGDSDAEIAAALEARHPTLRLVMERRQRVIKGALNVEHEGKFLAGFQIEILLDVTDVLGLPMVKEVGGRIPRTPERHINVADGSACLYLPEDLVVRHRKPFDVSSFISGPVRTFFLGQAGFELGAPFPLGEWGHGSSGIREMLAGLLGFDDTDVCVAFLELLSGKVIKAHWSCPCGSRRLLRCCHQDLVQGLRHRLPLQIRRFLLTQARTQLTKLEAAPRTSR